MSNIVTRFAPSPTGDLHIGSVRTALYCWLFSKHNQGKFILRIEDTDLARSTDAAIQVILEGMKWLGLDWDDGPYYQTKRFGRYAEVIQTLVDNKQAYRCYCTRERLDALREEQQALKLKPRYDHHCRELEISADSTRPYVIRFKNPLTGSVIIEDAIKGRIEIANKELDDLILSRTDGSPTYNLSVVVDDWDMGITHVIRGDDHINNTPRQMNIFHALGVTPPLYGHVPMILGPDGKKLSKRHGAVSVLQYKEEGFLPHALINYLVRLGWSHGDQELFSLEELIQHFDIYRISASPAAINPEKLLWINQHYLKTCEPEEIATHLAFQFENLNIDLSTGPSLVDVVLAFRERAKTLKEMAEKSRCYYGEVFMSDKEAERKFLTPESIPGLSALLDALNLLEDWNKTALQACFEAVLANLGLKMGALAQPLRVAVTGTAVSPPVDIMLALLGRNKTIKRLQLVVDKGGRVS